MRPGVAGGGGDGDTGHHETIAGDGADNPRRVQIDELLCHVALDGGRAAQAVRGLVEGGLITACGSAWVGGMPGLEFRLTEPGMAVAFGRACVEGDPRGAITPSRNRRSVNCIDTEKVDA